MRTAKTITLKASCEIHGQILSGLTVLNPGAWFGKCWLLTIECGYTPFHFVVEADTANDAIDELAENETYGHHLAIDVETEGADYGYEVNPGDIVGGIDVEEKGWINLRGEMITDEAVGRYLNEPYTSGQGVNCDLDHLVGIDEIKAFYLVDGITASIESTDYDEESVQEELDNALIDVEIPGEFIGLCRGWYDGSGSMLYAIVSTGGLTIGTNRPLDDDDEPMSDEAWQASLFDSLASDIRYAARLAEKSGSYDAAGLRRFETWAEEKAAELRREYGLED